MASGMVHVCVRVGSGWHQDGVRKVLGKRQYGVRMASGNVRMVQSRQECVKMRQDGVRMTSEWHQAGVRGVLGWWCRRQQHVRMR